MITGARATLVWSVSAAARPRRSVGTSQSYRSYICRYMSASVPSGAEHEPDFLRRRGGPAASSLRDLQLCHKAACKMGRASSPSLPPSPARAARRPTYPRTITSPGTQHPHKGVLCPCCCPPAATGKRRVGGSGGATVELTRSATLPCSPQAAPPSATATARTSRTRSRGTAVVSRTPRFGAPHPRYSLHRCRSIPARRGRQTGLARGSQRRGAGHGARGTALTCILSFIAVALVLVGWDATGRRRAVYWWASTSGARAQRSETG